MSVEPTGIVPGVVTVEHEHDGTSVILSITIPPGASALTLLQLVTNAASDALGKVLGGSPLVEVYDEDDELASVSDAPPPRPVVDLPLPGDEL